MSTQTDFAALVVRIDAATDRLEIDVQQLEDLINDAEGAISEELIELRDQARAAAAAAALSASEAATSATESATHASDAHRSFLAAQGEVTKAIAQVELARLQVVAATEQVTLAAAQVTAATTQADRAQTIADNLMALAPFDEAPKDGSTYGRNNGDWVVVEAGEGSVVLSVNGNLPDGSGNVVVPVPTKTSDITNDSGFITAADIPPQKTLLSEFTNDEGFITLADVPTVTVPTKTSELTNDSGFITLAEVPPSPITTDAPSDGKQYARQDAGWSEVTGGGGGPATVNFFYSTPFQVGYDPASAKVCFNYALYEAISTKGPWYWNDAATIDAVNTDEHWMTEAIVNPLGTNANGVALDIRYFRVYDVNPSTGAVKGHSGAIWNGTTWLPGNAFLGIVSQIVGEYTGGAVDASAVANFLPCGKWFYPKEIQKYTPGNEKALPTDQIGINHCMVTKTFMPYGGSETYPWGIYNNLELMWLTAGGTASRGMYFLQKHTDSWINVGSLS